ncbi:MAG: hypothetical protein ACI841_004559 [Planctomycetota bacterium]|jgi:hypothetical protein
MILLSPLSPALSVGVLVALVASPLSAQTLRDIPMSAPEFVEIIGQRELRGVLVARPLQLADASAYGLSITELNDRARLANELLSQYELTRYQHRTDETYFAVPVGSDEQRIANSLLSTGAFQYVEPDWTLYPVACPNDSNFGSQWHHAAGLMDSCAGWDVGTGDPSVVVAICDTGLRVTHEDIQLHRREGYNSVDGLWENSGGDISAVHPHGTMTTGCAAANGDNGVGIAGVGWNLGHRMMRVSNDSSGGSSIGALTDAAMTAVDAGDRVASVSYSGVTSAGVETAGQYCRNNNALLVWAAGNDSANLGGSRDDSVIVVGATDINDALASFSAFGSFVDLVAPGVSVYTMNAGSNSDYANVSGTSFSCPLTAGLCGLIWSVNPSLTPQEVEDFLRQGCDDLGGAGADNTFGYGRIDVASSVALANSPIHVTFPNGHPDFVDPNGGTLLNVNVAAASGSAVPNSGRLHVDSGSGFQTVALTETSPGVHVGSFPAAPCGNDIDWFVDFDLSGGGMHSSPASAPANTFSAQAWVITNSFFDDLEVSVGWTGGIAGDDATTGQWTYGNPLGTAAQPEDDHTAPGSNCWFTGQGVAGGGVGDNDVDGGSTTLLSPVLDASGMNNAAISYWRWYSNSAGATPNADIFVVEISDNGGSTWSNVETVGPTGAGTSGGWIQHSFQVSSIVGATNNIQLRFIASDLGSGSIIEAAIDDIAVDDYTCGSGCPPIMNYCQAAPNSVGSGATMSTTGSASVAANDLVLSASGMPATQPGLFYFGDMQVQLAFGNGFRCVGGTTVRLGVNGSDVSGNASKALDLTSLPGGALIQAGDTVNMQYWYRDPAGGGASFNLSDAVTATFCP